MSKNFELLRQAGWKQDFFEGAPTEAPPSPVRKNPTSASPPQPAPVSPQHAPASSRTAPPRKRARSVRSGNDQITSLVSRLFLDPHIAHVRGVAFAGVTPRSGCTSACAQTGRTLACMVGNTVCVIDANFSAPALHAQFSIDNLMGLSDALVQGKPARNFVRQIDGSNLHILAAGGQCARARSESPTVAQALFELRREFDYLLIDMPPVAGSSVSTIAHAADGAVLVVSATGVALDTLLRAKELLRSTRVTVLGAVLNDRKSSAQSRLGHLFK